LLCLIQNVNSQRLYGSLTAGYQYILSQDQPPTYIINSHHQITSPWFWRRESLSFKNSLTAKLKIGYELNDIFGLELSGSYFNTSIEQNSSVSTRHVLKGGFWRITPSFVVNVPYEAIDFYTRIGVSMIGGKIRYRQFFQLDSPANSFSKNTLGYEYTGPISIGFNGSVGIRKRINKLISLIVEIEFIYQNFSPNKGHTKSYEFDGEDQLASYEYPRVDTEIDFGEEQAFAGYQIQDKNVPEKLYRRNYSLSGFAFNIGIRFELWSKSESEEV